MDFKDFHKSIEDIFLYTRNLEELNKENPQHGLHYKTIPLEGNKRFLFGPIIYDETEISNLIDVFLKLKENILGDVVDSGRSSAYDVMMKYFGNPALYNLDIRKKAKDIGAQGLIHVRFYGKHIMNFEEGDFSITHYSGQPVTWHQV